MDGTNIGPYYPPPPPIHIPGVAKVPCQGAAKIKKHMFEEFHLFDD